jgi:TolB-like protein
MPNVSDRFSRFWLELKHRKTDKVVVVYAAAAFTIIQIVPTLQTALYLPDWTTTIVIIILAVGFPVSVIASWFYDISPGKIERTKPLSEIKSPPVQKELKKWKGATLISVLVIIGLVLFNIISSSIEASEIRQTEKTIAVLPFDNLSSDEELTNMCEALESFIITELNKIKEFTVRQRDAVMEFRVKKKSNPEIARKLKVFFIVTGDLIKTRNHILLNVNLVRAKNDKVVWAEHYTFNKEDEIFEKLNEMPVQIARNLLVNLTPETKRKIRNKPTRSAAAYMNYIKGNNSQDDAHNAHELVSTGDSIFKDLTASTSFNKAIEFYDKAIREDSTFALAYAKRSITRSWGCNTGHFNSDSDKIKCWYDAEKAMKLDGELTEGWIAIGFYYYYFVQDFDKALEWFSKAGEKEPDNWESKYYPALVLRANGLWIQSQKLMRQVGKIKPQDALILTNVGLSYQYLHQYDSAIYFHDKAIEALPRWTGPYNNKIESLIARYGNTVEAEAVMDTALIYTSGYGLQDVRINLDLYKGKFNEALFMAGYVDPSKFYEEGERDLLFAKIYTCLNNESFAKQYYFSALEFYSKKYAEDPKDFESLSLKGIAAAGLHDRLNAVKWGETAVNFCGKHVFRIADRTVDLAQIYIMVKEYDKAIKLIDKLLEGASPLSPAKLQLDPVWKPLYNIPAYKQLIAKYPIRNKGKGN